MNAATGPGPYAVVFRTHMWDDYVARQYRRLVSKVRTGDVFILLDETNGSIPVGEGKVVRHTQDSMKALGLADAGNGNMLWYNGDYPIYYFYGLYPDYRYYVVAEYDVVVHGDIDDMVAEAARNDVGLVALTKGEDVADWPHTESCFDVYAPDDVKKRLICFSIFSRDAVRALFERRLALSRDHEDGKIRRWPYCEAFVPTELARRQFKLMELSDLGSTEAYDWWPPILETDLEPLRQQTFVHPVLDGRRYVDASLRIWSPKDVLNPRSDLMRRLRRVPVSLYGPPLAAGLRRRAARALRRLGATVGARRA